MTTYHMFNAPPAPSDFELVATDRRFTFNQFATARGITGDQERFHDWLKEGCSRSLLTPNDETVFNRSTWEFIYTAFCQADDERDLADTQSDALL